MVLSNKIREFRFKSGEITQKQPAELIGVSRQTVNGIENSKHAPTIKVAIQLADAFSVSVDQLFETRNDGKPKRRSDAPKTTTIRKKASIEETIDDSAEHGKMEEEVEKSISLADLRNVI